MPQPQGRSHDAPAGQEEGEMERQILKGFTLMISIAGLALASAVTANGQGGKRLIAHVPFDFVVANKTFNAGECAVRPVTNAGSALLIESTDANARLITLTNGTGAAQN